MEKGKPSQWLNFFGIVLVTGATFNPLAAVAKGRLDKPKIINTISQEFNAHYVFPETAKNMEAALKKNLEAGRYDSIDDPQILAQKLKDDLIEVSRDKHINIFYEEEEPKDPAQGPEAQAKEIAAMASNNFGFKKIEILSGNIGYIDLRNFHPAEFAGGTAVAAMNYVAHTRALMAATHSTQRTGPKA